MPKIYLKDESFDPIYKSINPMFYFRSKILSGALMALGFFILGTQVAIPLIFFKTQNQDNITKPMNDSVLGIATGFKEFEFSELENSIAADKQENGVPKFFYVSIPKLTIENAIVETNSKNLSPETSLGHYLGSALPGEVGNAFVYGHSVLPWFFNPKNYKTIFSTLDNLESGDKFEVSYNNKKFTYTVESKKVLLPSEVNPLADYKPKYLNESTMTLMTCHPAGTKAKRLLVYATLDQ